MDCNKYVLSMYSHLQHLYICFELGLNFGSTILWGEGGFIKLNIVPHYSNDYFCNGHSQSTLMTFLFLWMSLYSWYSRRKPIIMQYKLIRNLTFCGRFVHLSNYTKSVDLSWLANTQLIETPMKLKLKNIAKITNIPSTTQVRSWM